MIYVRFENKIEKVQCDPNKLTQFQQVKRSKKLIRLIEKLLQTSRIHTPNIKRLTPSHREEVNTIK